MASPDKIRKRCSVLTKSFRFSGLDRPSFKHKRVAKRTNLEYDPNALILITHQTWHLYRISNLYNIKYSTAKLKQYAARIRHELIKSIKDTNNDITFSVKVEVLPELKESADDPDSLQIEVFFKKEESKPVLKYKGIILSWGGNNNLDLLTQLSLLLCVGAINVTRIVHKAINNLFDTQLYPLRISEDDLMCMSAMLSDSDAKTYVTFDFSLHGSSIKHTMLYTLPCTLIKDLWKHIHAENAEEISYKEVQIFHRLLQEQLEANYGIDFKFLKLNKIFMCDATISSEGTIKIFTTDAAVRVLSFISDVSFILNSANTDMTASSDDEYDSS